jgi:hypothetical protein
LLKQQHGRNLSHVISVFRYIRIFWTTGTQQQHGYNQRMEGVAEALWDIKACRTNGNKRELPIQQSKLGDIFQLGHYHTWSTHAGQILDDHGKLVPVSHVL